MIPKQREAGNPAKSAGREGSTHQENSTDAAASNLGPLGGATVLWVPHLRVPGGEAIYEAKLHVALTDPFATYPDACIVPYTCSPARRLKGEHANEPTLKLAWALVDLDGPRKAFKGKPGGAPTEVQAEHDAWVVHTLELASAFRTPPVAWMTRNGIRLLWALVPGMVTQADYTPGYSALLDELERHGMTGIDRACADWTRLQRLPHGSELLVPPGGVPQIDLPATGASIVRCALGAVSGPVTDCTLFQMLEAADPEAIGAVLGDVAHVRCPWNDEHSNAGAPIDSSTAILADRQGKGMGVFVCQHGHCDGRGNGDLLAMLKLNPAAAAVLEHHDERNRELAAQLFGTPANDNAGDPPAVREADAAGPDTLLATWRFRTIYLPKGGVECCPENLDVAFEHHPEWKGVFGFDELANQIVVLRDGPVDGLPVGMRWTADDAHPVQRWFNRQLHIKPGVDILAAAVKNVAQRCCPFHPVRDYLNDCRARWDGVPRSLIDYLGEVPCVKPADESAEAKAEAAARAVAIDTYRRAACAAWLRSAVARVMRPGCKADCVLILEGSQGAGKSSAVLALAGEGFVYEVSSDDVRGKDFMQDMAGKWIGEIPEIDRLIASKDESTLKAMVSKLVDRYRPSFGRSSQDFPRQVVFAGTTNRRDYLRDVTGNRRYWPVVCGVQIDLQGIVRDRDAIWGQAVAEYDAGQPWWLANEIEVAAREQQAERVEQDVWEELISAWVLKQTGLFTVNEALDALPGTVGGADRHQGHKNRMGRVLRTLGFERGDGLKRAGVKGQYWRRPDV
jgi:predicted P-loop ATPase